VSDQAQPPHRRRGLGVLAGLVAALAMTLVQALLRLGLGVPSPAELIGDRIGERVPVRPFLNLIGRVGSYGRLKALSVFGVLLVTLVLGAAVGALYARITERQRGRDGEQLGRLGLSRRGIVVLALVVFVAWQLSVAAFWPLLASYYRGAPRGTARVANAGWLLFAYSVFAATLIGAYRLLAFKPVGTPGTPAVATPHLGRRAVLAGGAGLSLAVATGGVLQRLYTRSTFGYDGLQNNGDVSAITPNDRFYVVTQNLIDPRVHQGSWQLEIGGEVDRPRTYDFAAISALPSVVQESTLC